jgi:phospholipid transport system substrate-binding protein
MTTRSLRPWLWFGTALLTTLAWTSAAGAEPPRPLSATEAVRAHFDQVLSLIQTPGFRTLDPERQRDQIRRVSNGLFNWSEMSRRALGAEWPDRTASERSSFSARFASLAEQAYMGPIERLAARGVPWEPVRYLGETRAGVETLVHAALQYPREMPIDFVTRRSGARWEVCDISIDGVSAADNYAAQVRRVRVADSFEGLLDRMTARAGRAPELSTAAKR